MLERLDGEYADCQQRFDYLAYRGAILLMQGDIKRATEALERALMLEPDSPGVQLDYAQALASAGELRMANSLLLELLNRTDLHPDFRLALESQRKVLLKSNWRLGFQLTSLLGFEENLNSAPTSRFVTLSSSAGDIVLELDPSNQRKKGFSWMNSLVAKGATNIDSDREIYLLGDVRSRQSAHSTNYLNVDGTAGYRGERSYLLFDDGHQIDVNFGLSQIEFDEKTLFRATRGEIAIEVPSHFSPGRCLSRLGLALENRRFPHSRGSNGRYIGAISSLSCMHSSGTFGFQAKTGRDRPTAEQRAGGAQDRRELDLAWGKDFGFFEAHVMGSLAWSVDQQGYSILLSDGTPRRIRRSVSKVEARVPLRSSWVWVISVEESRQASNVELFSSRNRSVYAGLRRNF